MTATSKGRRTPRRSEIKQAKVIRAAALRDWIQDRIAAAKAAGVGAAIGSTGGHGVTQQMRAIQGPQREWVHHHDNTGANRQNRRFLGMRVSSANQPYVNPARDLKPGRRLRRELRNEALS
jgi:hypothetical protein